MLHKAHLENKTLQDKLHTLSRQYKIVLQEEEQAFAQKKQLQDEYVSVSDPHVSQHVAARGCFPCCRPLTPPVMVLKSIDNDIITFIT